MVKAAVRALDLYLDFDNAILFKPREVKPRVAQRTTMDVDTTVIGLCVDEELVKQIVVEVAATDVGDGIRFDVDLSAPGTITKDDDYGFRNGGIHSTPSGVRKPCAVNGNAIAQARHTRRRFTSQQPSRLSGHF